ncbi:hypothetical protein ACOMHN_010917 [Nucella lapillus]
MASRNPVGFRVILQVNTKFSDICQTGEFAPGQSKHSNPLLPLGLGGVPGTERHAVIAQHVFSVHLWPEHSPGRDIPSTSKSAKDGQRNIPEINETM